MVHNDRLLIVLIRTYAAARCISVSYASRLLTGSGDTVDRVAGGMSITARRAETIIRRASAHWPAASPWPAEIPRPAPAAESGRGARGAAGSPPSPPPSSPPGAAV